MAMLAEPRRRQRIGPNPRGKFFTEDEDNRGRAMLQKLGWKDGDGLGVQKQGMQEPIRPKIQMNSNGLGYDIRSDPWMDHSKEFSALLEDLQVVHNGTPVEKSEDTRAKLEAKSKTSRSRIHYHKFTRGKDLSSISNKEWTCIFGKTVNLFPSSSEETPSSTTSGSNSPNNQFPDEEVTQVEEPEETQTETPDKDNTINRGSMQDYFKKKMAEKKLKEKEQPTELEATGPDLVKSMEVEESQDSIGKNDALHGEDLTEDSCEQKVSKKSKDKKRRKRELELEDSELVVSIQESGVEETPKDKKRRKKTSDLEVNPEEPKEEILKETPDKDNMINRGSMYDYFKQKLAEKQLKEKNGEGASTELQTADIATPEPEPVEEERPKEKKRRKKNVDVEAADCSAVETVEEEAPKEKKRSKKTAKLESQPPYPEVDEEETPKLKKRSKKEAKSDAIAISVADPVEEETPKLKKRSKKTVKLEDADIPASEPFEQEMAAEQIEVPDIDVSELTMEETAKKEKRRKKKLQEVPLNEKHPSSRDVKSDGEQAWAMLGADVKKIKGYDYWLGEYLKKEEHQTKLNVMLKRK